MTEPAEAGKTSPSGAPKLAQLLEVVRCHPDFRRLFLSRYASLLGDWFNLLAILALIRQLGADDARSVGILLILKLLPATLAGPVAGVAADRWPRRTILLIADGSRFLFVLMLFAAPSLPIGSGLPLVYVLTGLQTSAQAFSEPARLASIPNVVPSSLLGAANALGAMTWSIMFTLGAGLGGLVTSLLGWRVACAIDASTYLVSIALVLRVSLPPPPRHPEGLDVWTVTGLRDLARLWVFLRRSPLVSTTLLAKTGWGLAGGITLTLTLFGERIYPVGGRPALGIAVMYMARGLGTAVGPVLARWLTREATRALPVAIGASFFLAAGAYALFAISSTLVFAVPLVVVAHFGGSTVWVFSTLLLQRTVPDMFRGRVFSADLGLATGTISLTTWVYSEIVDRDWIDLRWLPMLLAVTLVVSGLAWSAAVTAQRRAERRQSPTP